MNNIALSRRFRAVRFLMGFCGYLIFCGACYADPDATMSPQQDVVSDTSSYNEMQVATLVPTSPVGEAPSAPADLILREEETTVPQKSAMTAAVADGVTTSLAISAGAVETNPFVVATPAGLLLLTGTKIGMVKYGSTLPQEQRRVVMKTTSAFWGGAAANNLMVLMAVPTPFSLVVGLVTGVGIWSHINKVYEKQDETNLAQRESLNGYHVAHN